LQAEKGVCSAEAAFNNCSVMVPQPVKIGLSGSAYCPEMPGVFYSMACPLRIVSEAG